MPEYVLRCPNGHHAAAIQPMVTCEQTYCQVCGELMWRKPQPVAVTWGGLKPSGGELAPALQDLVDNQPRNAAEFEAIHEAHERKTDA